MEGEKLVGKGEMVYGGGKKRRGLTLERPLIGHIVDQENAHRATVVGGRDGSETFLTGCIPDLQFHSLAIQLDCTDLEVDTNGCNEGRGERVLTEAQQTA
jgi:hypothetical protein